jgi:spore maturation protein A
MMGIIWVAMLATGTIWSAVVHGPAGVVGTAVSSAKEAVQLCLALAGSIGLWSGIAQIAQQSGLTDALASAIRPLVGPLFPELGPKSRSLPLIAASMAANLLGLGMAATPLGLAAMQQLASESRTPAEPTDAMCTFIIVTASSLTLVPTTIISLRAEMGSTDPAAVVGATIAATACSTLAAVILDLTLRKRGLSRR